MPNNGIFSLSSYYNKDVSGDIPEKSRETYREYGYFLGGGGAAFDRLDFSNDTLGASNRGLYPFAVAYQGATGNQNFGYVNGGYLSTTISRINYSNESTSLRTPTILPAGIGGACSNNNFGYFGGGGNPGGGRSVVQRVDYSNDLSTPTFRGPLSQNRFITAGVSNSNFGYFYGSRSATTIVDRINYSSDTTLTLRRGNFQFAHEISSSAGNNFYGYWLGGSATTRVQRLDYANDLATGSIRGSLVFTIGAHGSATGNSNFGYAERGGGGTADIQRVDYSNDLVVANIRGKLSIATPNGLGACSSASFGGSPNSQYGVFAKPFGYFGGGGFPSVTSSLDRIDYSNDTAQGSIRSPLLISRSVASATGNSNFGYFGGGSSAGPGTPTFSSLNRIDYSTETQSLLTSGFLSLARFKLASTGNSNFGYFGGGAGPVSTVDRINYSNDNNIALLRGPLSLARFALASTGNSNFGYFGGGNATPVSTIDRIDYSNDTATASVRGPLSSARYRVSATGNSNFGYFSGTSGGSTTVDRADYSNDTATASVRGPLSVSVEKSGATGTFNFGYFGGTITSTLSRIDYSNDSATATTRGALSSARYAVASTSPTAFGGATDFQPTSTFFDIQSMRRIEDTTNYSVKKRALGSFGYFGGNSSILSRIDFSNDLSTASSRAVVVMTSNESYAGTGNNNFGYFGGGYIQAPLGGTSTVGRVDYSNDSAICSIRGPLTSSLRLQSASGTLNFGYFAGGISGGSTRSTITRIDYSNDLLTSRDRTSTGNPKTVMGFTSNNNFGYLAAGFQFPSTAYSNVDRINYSNDNSSTSVRGNLTSNKSNQFNFGFGATGNSNFGYFGGGSSAVVGLLSTVDRIDYSNDIATTSLRGPLSSARYNSAATGNSNFGYFGGGSGSTGPVSTVNRINYSNDTETASVRGPLFLSGNRTCAITNARNS